MSSSGRGCGTWASSGSAARAIRGTNLLECTFVEVRRRPKLRGRFPGERLPETEVDEEVIASKDRGDAELRPTAFYPDERTPKSVETVLVSSTGSWEYGTRLWRQSVQPLIGGGLATYASRRGRAQRWGSLKPSQTARRVSESRRGGDLFVKE